MEMAQSLERACSDFILVADKLMVRETFGGSRDGSLRHGTRVHKHVPLATAN